MAVSDNDLKKPSFPNESLRISAFPRGTTPWRIDWFGDVAFPDRSRRRKQPSVTVYLSQVTDPPQPNSKSNYQRHVQVSVGTLPLLRIGDIWCDGRLHVRPDYELEEFLDVQIDRSIALIKAGLNLDEKGFLLPRSEHPGHMQCTKSYCMMVDLPESRRLIIPCMEMIRFYFGSSNGLVTKLFLPPLARNSLYEEAVFDSRSGRLFLELAEKMSGASAADIGRLYLDPIAWRSAAHVGASLLKASVVNQAIYPQAFFPFEGKTKLVAAGKWLSFADQPKATFLVYNLRSCSHPFPFDSLRYQVKGARTKPHEGGATQNRAGARDASDQPIVEHDPSNNLIARTRTFRVEPRFPDLTPKSIWKDKALSFHDHAARRSDAPDIENSALGEPGSECRTRPMDIALLATAEFRKSDQIPEFLRKVVFQLRLLQGLRVELLTESNDDGWTVPLSTLSKEIPIDESFFVTKPRESLDIRRACVLAFNNGDEQVCAVVVDSEPVHMKLYPTTGQDSDQVWMTLRCAPGDFRRQRGDEAHRDEPTFPDVKTSQAASGTAGCDDPVETCFSELTSWKF